MHKVNENTPLQRLRANNTSKEGSITSETIPFHKLKSHDHCSFL